ncbi:MAG: exodeoxyribonuclease VII large subunit [Mycobacteriales bacterium]
MALSSTPESPLPVRTVAKAISDWVGRLGRVWVEGQVTELTRRPGVSSVFFTLRDPVADVSVQVRCGRDVYNTVVPPLASGARVVLSARPEFFLTRGTLSLTAYEIRPLGLGALLARLEALRAVLAAEGLFAAERKRPLPFLPRVVGLVTGRASAAERDVLDNARRRWPAVRFRVEAVAVQGPFAVESIIGALTALDADPEVEVIVLARGGGSVEDLLPFSDEALCRRVAGCRTPVVSAVGHESDVPLLDLVADRRASTPTDAAKLVVPDVAEEAARVLALRDRARRSLGLALDREYAGLAALRGRPVLADPARQLERHSTDTGAFQERAGRAVAAHLATAVAELGSARARLIALSPAATLERGYAVVQRRDRTVVRTPEQVSAREMLRLRLAGGELRATVSTVPAAPR